MDQINFYVSCLHDSALYDYKIYFTLKMLRQKDLDSVSYFLIENLYKCSLIMPCMYRWTKLKDALIDNRSKLGEAQTLQQFSRDADEMENWLQEKLQIASDESYKDPANIQNKHQKHQGFEAELAANADRLQALLGTGQGIAVFILFAY